ncbi:MAG: type I restriction enzyme endonuclease domain-containing protein [Wenzhouxiangellaceae bacterium]
MTLQEQAYDEQNRLLETRSPHSDTEDSVTRFAYDGEGNQTGLIDSNGRITVREYDAIDRLAKEADPAGGLTEFGYDARSQLNRVVAPNNATTTFEFDQLSRQIAENSPDRGTITQEYDLADNLTASTDARGIRREMRDDGPPEGLTEEEFAFYGALLWNEEELRAGMADEALKELAIELTRQIRESVTIDWTQRKKSARARIMRKVKALLRRYKYPRRVRKKQWSTYPSKRNDWLTNGRDNLQHEEIRRIFPVERNWTGGSWCRRSYANPYRNL